MGGAGRGVSMACLKPAAYRTFEAKALDGGWERSLLEGVEIV